MAILPYASASLYPMSMADYSDEQKRAATATLRKRTAANFREVFRELSADRVIPAGGEYVLGGPAAALSRYLPQPLETELAAALGELGRADALAKLYPGDELDARDMSVRRDPRAAFRGFDDTARATYALTLEGQAPSFTELRLPGDLEFDWPRALKKCAANYAARRRKMGLEPAIDVYLDCREPGGERAFLFRLALDSDACGLVDEVATDDRPRLTYEVDRRLLFCLITALLSWNAMEASALMKIRRSPDTYSHDVHRSIVHFTLLS